MQTDWKSKIEPVFAFHTKRAPGIPIGVCMVDYALEILGGKKDTTWAICESDWCLPDPIQVVAGITIGTRKLKIQADSGRFAFTFYDWKTGEGVRMFVDVGKIDEQVSPELYKFFHRLRGPEVEQGGEARKRSNEKVIAEFETLGRSIIGWEKVRVKKTGKDPIPPVFVCAGCGESAQGVDKTICENCSGNAYYEKDNEQ